MTIFTRVPLPAVAMFFPYQGASLEVSFSIMGCMSMLFRPLVESGKPRYLIGKLEI
jgi:hypothetical protein